MPRINHSPAARRTRQLAGLAEVARALVGDAPLAEYDFGGTSGPVVALARELDKRPDMGCKYNPAGVNRNLDDEAGGPMLVVARRLLNLAYTVLSLHSLSEEDLDPNAEDYEPWQIMFRDAKRELEEQIELARRFSSSDKELLNIALRNVVLTPMETVGPNIPVYDLTHQSACGESPTQTSEADTIDPSGVCDGPAERKPKWDANSRTLTYAGLVLKCYKSHPADNQVSVLAAFEAAGWPCSVASPLRQDQIRDTVRALKDSIGEDAPIRFASDGTGQGIRWDIYRR